MQGVICRLIVVSLLAADVIASNRKYYESCVDTIDCVDPFLCLSSLCNCDDNQTIASDHLLCLKGVSYGESCRETGQCLLMLADTVCGKINKCECTAGYGYNTASNDCSTIIGNAVAHGGKCRLSKQCKSGMVCEGQICECRTGLRWDRTSLTCIPIVEPKKPGTCSDDQDCTQNINTQCSNGNCICKAGYKFITDPKKGNVCSEGAGLRSVMGVALLSVLLSKLLS